MSRFRRRMADGDAAAFERHMDDAARSLQEAHALCVGILRKGRSTPEGRRAAGQARKLTQALNIIRQVGGLDTIKPPQLSEEASEEQAKAERLRVLRALAAEGEV